MLRHHLQYITVCAPTLCKLYNTSFNKALQTNTKQVQNVTLGSGTL